MNERLDSYARKLLKEDLLKCSEDQQHFFKQMYANGNMDLTIDSVVDNMPNHKLDAALSQVERTLNKDI